MSFRAFVRPFLALLLIVFAPLVRAETITIAAAADLKFAMDELIGMFSATYPNDTIEVVYGSSGNFNAQIRQGAPFDLYFSADISYPRALADEGLAAGPVQAYATGRLVLWTLLPGAEPLTLAQLADPAFARIAIANPRHAPYGKRAEEALRAAGVLDSVSSRLVYGENVAQTAQFVQSGNAQAGIVALSLVLSPELAGQGRYLLVPDELHEPLEQGFIVTRRAADSPLAQAFAAFMRSDAARDVMTRYGFALPAVAP